MANKTKTRILPERRNNSLFDGWSIVHMSTGVALGWIMNPVVAIILMILWEPLEIFILSPILGKYGIVFGYESLRNSLSDIVFDTAGVLIGAFLVAELIMPPFHF